ncbi:hypothetical protein LL912_16550 [Niabella sp. CC-SYL272]|uniref:hypothetical protein n=1 Tax=Niabella agricola TaxID=2891571 RepID=UPI001F18C1DB|nr:hypothetical protein [Niabella agricola]MCF3110397.1 hypothetical protein [Niabella agricola]
MNKNRIQLAIFVSLLLTMACGKKDYFEDTGKHAGTFNGTALQYLQSKPQYFDSLVKVIRLAGMEQQFSANNITFFAPADSSIRSALRKANEQLDRIGKPRITRLEEIAPAIWKKHLSKYLFSFVKSLNDFSQIDFANINTYAGQMYQSAGGVSMNIGAVYQDVLLPRKDNPNEYNVIKYAGARVLTISYLTSPFTPRDVGTWRTANVSSVNIKPVNGYVHLVGIVGHDFGFSDTEFANDVAYFNN